MRCSTEARRCLTAKSAAADLSFLRGVLCCFLGCVIYISLGSLRAASQSVPETSAAPSATAPKSESKQSTEELASHDEPATFKVNVKLVVVRAVVRDSQGHAVGNLQKEDFQVLDKGKPQVITQFDVEQPGMLAAKARQTSTEIPGEEISNSAPASAVPERFVAYMFDDVHLEFGDLALVRQAAERHFATLRPTDRAAIFTTSGQTNLGFTDDRVKLHEALLQLRPRPIVGSFKDECPQIGYYQADLIVNKNDPQATSVAVQETLGCTASELQTASGVPAATVTANAGATVTALAYAAVSNGDHESLVALDTLKKAVLNVSRMPGQRSVVLVSPGFIAPQLEYDYLDIIDRALRSQVIISALDARGLYTVLPFGDISANHVHPPPPAKMLIETAAASAQDDLLAVLADGTGGVFFHNSNDFDDGFRRVAQAPEYSYVLAFTPQNLKLDGSYHTLKVTLKNRQKLTLQARRGYYAPKHVTDPNEQAKQEIEDAMYSQEELHNLPVKLRTQFFKASDEDAKLVVLAHVDVQHLRFRKAEGRNNNVLTCVSALFNRNGNFLQGTEKVVTMHWKDETLEHKLNAGITLKTSFDVKPGSYMVRLVVRDAEGQSMSAESGTVEIR
jgi:VWFA-related protein